MLISLEDRCARDRLAVDELAQFFVTGPSDAADKLSEFLFPIYRKDVSALRHSMNEILRHFQGHGVISASDSRILIGEF